VIAAEECPADRYTILEVSVQPPELASAVVESPGPHRLCPSQDFFVSELVVSPLPVAAVAEGPEITALTVAVRVNVVTGQMSILVRRTLEPPATTTVETRNYVLRDATDETSRVVM
jgi:hypothetical protein